jgi:hypothetical protein
MNSKSLLLAILIISLGACASKGPERPKVTPEQSARIYRNLIKSWDSNGDGAATCADVELNRRALFTKLDANGDKLLRKGEYRLASFDDKSFVFIEFETADIDESRRIDLNEFLLLPNRSFQGIDRDSNCELDEEEAVIAALADRSRLGARGDEDKKQRGRRGGKLEEIDDEG